MGLARCFVDLETPEITIKDHYRWGANLRRDRRDGMSLQ
jgi:hypothetical protein